MTNLYPTNEVLTAIVSNSVKKDDLQTFTANPKDYLMSVCNVDLQADIKFNVVENSDNEVALTLPYYAANDQISAFELTPEQMQKVTGGEILAFIICALSMVGATVASAVGIGSITAGAAAALGGAIVAAGAVTGAVAVAGVASAVGVGTSEAVKAGVRSK